MKKSFMLLAAVVMALVAMSVESEAGNKTTLPSDYGKVVIDKYSRANGLAPVVFDHWLHRAEYTCKLCHVDIGFALKAGGTDIKAEDNMGGLYCGVCHNGKMLMGERAIFQACSKDKADMRRCERCHSQGKNVQKEIAFAAFTSRFVKDKFGNGINWEKTASDGLIHPVNYIEGVSMKKPAREIQQDFAIQPRASGMGKIIFSHKKHTAWNGCETCHPEIFAGGKRGSTKFTMEDIKAGKFCGVCHTTVSFPLEDCSRCHAKSS
jgi:c(7)-type cytochrome triheme protein